MWDTCGILLSGHASCWGYNGDGQLGRLFGMVGLVFAVLNPLANFTAVTVSWLLSIF